MKSGQWREALVELGIVVLVCGLIACVIALLSGGLRGLTHHGKGESESPPNPGQVPSHRHQHTAAVSTR